MTVLVTISARANLASWHERVKDLEWAALPAMVPADWTHRLPSMSGSRREPRTPARSGRITGIEAGDVIRFRDARGTVEGELTDDGDEMNGTSQHR